MRLNSLLLHIYLISGPVLKICKASHCLHSNIVRRRPGWVGEWMGTRIISASSGNRTPIPRSLSHYTGWAIPTPSSFPGVIKNDFEVLFWTLNKRSANVQHVCLTVTNGEYDLLNRKLSKNCSRAKWIERRLVELAIIQNTQEFIQALDFKEFTNYSNIWAVSEKDYFARKYHCINQAPLIISCYVEFHCAVHTRILIFC